MLGVEEGTRPGQTARRSIPGAQSRRTVWQDHDHGVPGRRSEPPWYGAGPMAGGALAQMLEQTLPGANWITWSSICLPAPETYS